MVSMGLEESEYKLQERMKYRVRVNTTSAGASTRERGSDNKHLEGAIRALSRLDDNDDGEL